MLKFVLNNKTLMISPVMLLLSLSKKCVECYMDFLSTTDADIKVEDSDV